MQPNTSKAAMKTTREWAENSEDDDCGDDGNGDSLADAVDGDGSGTFKSLVPFFTLFAVVTHLLATPNIHCPK